MLRALLYLQRHEQNQTEQKAAKSNSGWKTFQISKYIRDISCRAYYTRHMHCISLVKSEKRLYFLGFSGVFKITTRRAQLLEYIPLFEFMCALSL